MPIDTTISNVLKTMPSSMHLLPTGGVLIMRDQETYILEPDAKGKYETGYLRRVADSSFSSLEGQASLLNDGSVMRHPGEYGSSSNNLSGPYFTEVFDPVTEKWSFSSGFSYPVDPTLHGASGAAGIPICAHSPSFITDDGRVFGNYGILPANTRDTANGTISPVARKYSTDLGVGDTSYFAEVAYALLPDGRAICMNSRMTGGLASIGTPEQIAIAQRISFLNPAYSTEFKNAGSFQTGNDDISFVSMSTVLNNLGTDFRSPINQWSATGSHDVTCGYEMGPTIYNPKFNKVVHFSGSGCIYMVDYNTYATTKINMPLEPPPSDPNSLYAKYGTQVYRNAGLTTFPDYLGNLYWGTVASVSGGKNRASIIGSRDVAFFVDPTPGETEADRNARINFYKRGSGTVSGMILYIYTENNTRCTALRYSDVSFINGQYRFVLVDFDGSGVPLYVWVNNDTDIINTGAWVMSGRPYHTTRDMCCAILPNGDMLYHSAVAGGDRADDWANRSSVYTFDGSSITEVQDSPVGLRTDTRMMPLPDGSILYFDAGAFYTDAGYKGPARRYIPTQSQAIPFPNSRPVISSFPYRLEPGQSATLFGVQLNGLHEGMAEGDDYASRTNFPLVRLTNKFNGNVHYCRTYGYSYRGIQPNRASQCSVEIPNWVPIGDYSMEVVANGVPSTPRDITIKFDSGSGSFMNRYS